MALRRRRLAQRRRACGYSQEAFAEALQVDRTTVVRWETADTEPQPWHRRKIAEVLRVSLEELHELLADITGTAGSQQAAPTSGSAPTQGAITKLVPSAQDIGASEGIDVEVPPPHLAQIRVGADDVTIRLDARALTPQSLALIVDAFAIGSDRGPSYDSQDATSAGSPPTFSPLEVDEVLGHLREQWHALVRTDNLLGPRHALAGVRGQLTVLTELMQVLQGTVRREVVRLAAQYAESAAWLHEDAGEFVQAQMWTSQAMEWAYEADDATMLAWTAYRRSQHSALIGDAQGAIGLAQAARRNEECLARPMRAATRVQEARGHALAGDELAALWLLDEAHSWAADDVAGEARGGHGSFCTASYIEIHRAGCFALLGKAEAAITCYEQALPGLPAVYRRDRAAALAGKAIVHAAAGQPDIAAATARAALPVARRAGSRRIVRQLTTVGRRLAPYRHLPTVAALLDDLAKAA